MIPTTIEKIDECTENTKEKGTVDGGIIFLELIFSCPVGNNYLKDNCTEFEYDDDFFPCAMNSSNVNYLA